MIDFLKLPIGTIISTYYTPTSRYPTKHPYQLTGVITATQTGTCLKVLEGGWNHTPFCTYNLASTSDTEYTDRKIIPIEDYPYPEKLL